jgi:GNAT superfamily N-acetyltransferase
MALDDTGEPVGTIAIDLVPDEGLWTAEDLEQSFIVHRMMVPRMHAGKDIGRRMVEFAEDLARSHGRRKLVIDVWNTNKELHEYYERLGFRYVRTVSGHWTPSATLFEKEVANFDPSVRGPKLTPVPFKDEGR